MKIQELIEPIIKLLDPFIELKNLLKVKDNCLVLGDRFIDFKNKQVHLISIGKSAAPLLASLQRFFIENQIETTNVSAIILDHRNSLSDQFTFWHRHLTGNHPIPRQKSYQATKELIDYLSTIKNDDICFFLISGGTSSLLEIPKESISLQEFEKRSHELFEKGLSILELNRERAQLSQVKGGNLLNFCKCENIYNLIVNDTPQVDDRWVGSGPTFGKRAISFNWDNREKLKKRLEMAIPDVLWLIEPEVENWDELYRLAKNQNEKKVGMLGEITLSLPVQKGQGGRNTHYAAYLLDQKSKRRVELGSFLSMATDGEDGSSLSAGAYWDDSIGIDPRRLEQSLQNFDSAKIFLDSGLLVPNFKSLTNLMDIRIYFI